MEQAGWRRAALTAALAFVSFRLVTAAVAAGVDPGAIRAWEQWDGNWYIAIARQGYAPLSPMVDKFGHTYDATVFFPFFPALIAGVSRVAFVSAPVAALLVSSVALFFALVGLYRLADIDYGSRIATLTLVLLLVFPSSLFLVAPYSESLLLLFGVGAFLAARAERWWLAGVLAALAILTKAYMGILAVALLVEYISARNWSWRRIDWNITWLIALPAIALGGWMAYLGWQFHEPLRFIAAQRFWDHHFAPPWETMRDGVGFLLHLRFVGVIDFTSFVLLIALTIYTLVRVRTSYGVMLALAAIAFTITANLGSTNRYQLTLFPLFIAAARLLAARPWIAGAAALGSAPIAVVLLVRFSTGHWAG